MTSSSVVAVIPAAGIGSRMQADRPKQYLPLQGKTILEHTAELLLNHHAIDYLVIAISSHDTYFPSLSLANNPKVKVVEGGNERADSVLNAINTLPENTWALVHDAARPCVSAHDITNLLAVMDNRQVAGGILASRVRDTMKRGSAKQAVNAGFPTVLHTESRENLWHALTPQLFPTTLLKSALRDGLAAGATITDEASAIEYVGHTVALIDSDPANIKITHPGDLPLADFYLHQRQKAQTECE
ncbi:4-diphosphocytidyl-2C-methyl-D-erythritol synthase [Alteromonas sp. 38]|uniref:2-C-methyl-D-erythritol 4-phosphate cytidylyltransferase n=1 Tax=Alteromonas TaxID=226 RepID=UPI0012EF086C|nr:MULTISPECIES: 2-C-methyl-D-erythritol 4-phosphate cytidylyltransferase [Alteromonas]CAD5292120.1 4-diphosphocytidyl-2C-methyl-D-erythritol synthase [Alteromonas sp. 154]VXB17464.1 4-diphosphocytidyl-2C-methyl-D-erythritol synthase [Alteromonas sp. 38]